MAFDKSLLIKGWWFPLMYLCFRVACFRTRRSAVVKRVITYLDNCVSQHLNGAGSSPAGSVGRDLNLQKLNYQYLTTSVAVVLVVH